MTGAPPLAHGRTLPGCRPQTAGGDLNTRQKGQDMGYSDEELEALIQAQEEQEASGLGDSVPNGDIDRGTGVRFRWGAAPCCTTW